MPSQKNKICDIVLISPIMRAHWAYLLFALLYLSSYLEMHGISTKIIDLKIKNKKRYIDTILKIIDESKPLLIGLTCYTSGYNSTMELAQIIGCLYYTDMIRASRGGYDISADLKEFNQKLSSLPPNVQRDVRIGILKAHAKELLRRSPLWNIAGIKTLWNRLNILFQGDGATKFIRGSSVGVYDIASCADHLVEIAQALKQPIDAWDPQKNLDI